MHRKPEQSAELATLGALPVEGDLVELSVEDLIELMRGHNIVVFSAGAGGAGMEITAAIDGKGLEKSVDAAMAAGVTRVLLVSVFPDALRDGERKEGFENYILVKKRADAYLVASGLISRLSGRAPSPKTMEPGKSKPISQFPTAAFPATTLQHSWSSWWTDLPCVASSSS
jgi:hypothetical protein